LVDLFVGSTLYGRLQADATYGLLITSDPNNTVASSKIVFDVDGSERARIDASGRLLVGGTTSSGSEFRGDFFSGSASSPVAINVGRTGVDTLIGTAGATNNFVTGTTQGDSVIRSQSDLWLGSNTASNIHFYTSGATERARITSGGEWLVAKSALGLGNGGMEVRTTDAIAFTKTVTSAYSGALVLNRASSVGDGTLVEFLESDVAEGSISVSGTTVSYNGGHLSRWAQTLGPKDETLVKGTVLSNLDEMNQYTDADGNPVSNEQLNKVKVSDVEGDANVAGVFVNWSHDEAHDVDEINMAMTGDMIIRIAHGVVVQRGDLLMSAGDGTAKPQGDDIIRSKTVAKVTSTHVTCTYPDGSYCVPCVLMAC
jgi:hypothetical protein